MPPCRQLTLVRSSFAPTAFPTPSGAPAAHCAAGVPVEEGRCLGYEANRKIFHPLLKHDREANWRGACRMQVSDVATTYRLFVSLDCDNDDTQVSRCSHSSFLSFIPFLFCICEPACHCPWLHLSSPARPWHERRLDLGGLALAQSLSSSACILQPAWQPIFNLHLPSLSSCGLAGCFVPCRMMTPS